MSEKLWSPRKKCTHDLPLAHDHNNRLCAFRCGGCDCVFESRPDEYGVELFGWRWYARSERWLKRKLRKEARRGR